MRRIGWSFLLLGLMVGVACAGEEAPQNKGPGEPKAQVIGVDGGVIEFEGLSVSVPAGALTEDVEITVEKAQVEPTGDFTRLSAVYEFGPDGLQFLLPVAVTIPFTGAAEEPGIYWASTGEPFARIGGTVEGGAVTAEVTHFSQGFVGGTKTEEEEEPTGGALVVDNHRSWLRTGTSSYQVAKVVVAADGDLFIHGQFAGPLDLGGAPIEGQGYLLARIGLDGKARWTRTDLPPFLAAMGALPNGGLVLAWGKKILALDADGEDDWHLDVSSGEITPVSVAVDETGKIAFVGGINGDTNLGGGVLSSTGGQPALLAILDSTGKLVHAEVHYGEEGSTAHHLVAAAPGGGFFLAGTYFGTGPDLGGGNLPANGGAVSMSAFTHVARFSSTGSHLWSVAFGTEGGQSNSLYPITLTSSDAGELGVVLSYSIASLELETGVISEENGPGLVVLTLSETDGSLLRHRAFSGARMERGSDVANDGLLYLTGGVNNGASVDFGDGPVPSDEDLQPGQHGYLAVVDQEGGHLRSHGWAGWFDQETGQSHHLEGVRFMPDGRGGYWFLGIHEGTTDLAPGITLEAVGERRQVLVHFSVGD